MFALEITGLKKWVQDRLLLDLEELKVKRGDKIGVVGVNGAGKSTLFRMIAGEDAPDEGQIRLEGTLAWIRPMEETPNEPLSGGEWVRRRIREALGHDPALLLLDEPTTHLDLEATQWVEKELVNVSSAVLLISHDRDLLDAVCDAILEIENGRCVWYPGNYSEYRRLKKVKKEKEWAEYERYVAEKKRLLKAAQEAEARSRRMKSAPSRMGNSEARLVKWKTAAKRGKVDQQTKQLRSRLERLEEKEKPHELPQVQFDLQAFRPIEGKSAIHLEKLTAQAKGKTLFSSFSCVIPTGRKVAVLGKNGAGKSTLLSLIHQKAEGVKLAPAASIGYFHQQLTILDEDQSVLENVKRDSSHSETLIRTALSRLLFRREEVLKPVRVLSGGEKVKVALTKLFFSQANLLLLDEPSNFLDIHAREELEKVLKAYPGTILFATHDRRLVRELADAIIWIHQGKAVYFDGEFEAFLAWQNQTSAAKPEKNREEERLRLEHEITEVLSRLSLMPPPEEAEVLEQRFQELLRRKRDWDRT